MAAGYPEFRYMVDVIDSVIDSGADELLAGSTTIHDLMVVPRPVVIGKYGIRPPSGPHALEPMV
jgi:hypothetical protein